MCVAPCVLNKQRKKDYITNTNKEDNSVDGGETLIDAIASRAHRSGRSAAPAHLQAQRDCGDPHEDYRKTLQSSEGLLRSPKVQMPATPRRRAAIPRGPVATPRVTDATPRGIPLTAHDGDGRPTASGDPGSDVVDACYCRVRYNFSCAVQERTARTCIR